MEDTLITNPKSLTFRVLLRFIRGFVAGAIASMATIVIFTGNGWSELKTWLIALSLAGLTGGITGGIMALDKYFRK